MARIRGMTLGLAALVMGSWLAAAGVGGAGEAGERARMFPISLGEPAVIDVKSQGVEWRGNTYHLLRFGKARFRLDAEGRLLGTLTGGVTTFDDVPYEVHLAVFDGGGGLLGTAKAACPVQRIWLGKPLLETRTLEFDFGVSLAYRQAKSFSVAISERKVLTPADWQRP
jgi:hypothetical protein